MKSKILGFAAGLLATLSLAALAQVSGGGVEGGGGQPAGNAFSIQYKSGTRFGGTGPGTSGQVLTSRGAGLAPTFQPSATSGTVTSVGLTMPTGFSVANSPVTTAGTLAVTTTLNGVLKGNGSGFTTSTSADIIGLWTGTCNASSFLRGDGACAAAGTGTVTSVGLSAPALFTIGSSPVTTNGTLSLSYTVGQALPFANGGTNLTSAADDTVMLSTGSAWAAAAVPNCGSSTQALAYTTATNSFSCQTVTGSGGTPAGSNTQVQFNNSGAFGADADFVYDSTLNQITLGSVGTAGSIVGAVGGASTGSSLTIQGGTGLSGGAGILRGGVPTAGTGGGVQIIGAAGVGTNQNGGGITLTSGVPTGTGGGGSITLTGANAATTSAQAGAISITAGTRTAAGSGGAAGEVLISSGDNSNSTGSPNPVTLVGGNSVVSGSSSNIVLKGGPNSASSGGAGNVDIRSGINTNSGAGGFIVFSTGSAANTLTERVRMLANGGVSFGSSGTAVGTSGQALLSAGGGPPVWTTIVRSGTSASLGGGALGAGACASNTTSVTGAASGMTVDVTPTTYPGDAFYWKAYVSSSDTITTLICAATAGTPTASTYNLRVFP
jgi:hypothetical protein